MENFSIFSLFRDNAAIISWIRSNYDEKLTSSPSFIRTLTTVVTESCINGIGKFIARSRAILCNKKYQLFSNFIFLVGGPHSQIFLDEESFKNRSQILKTYLKDDSDLEFQSLLALQYLIHRWA